MAFPIPREAPVTSTVFLDIKPPFLSLCDAIILTNSALKCNEGIAYKKTGEI